MSLRIEEIRFTDPGFERCLRIRLEVFVQEQKVPLEEERDAYDPAARHFLAAENGIALGTARVVVLEGGAAKIGRVAVAKSARGRGIGAALIRHIEDAVPAPEYRLDAQTQALPFYARLGYIAQGEEFPDAGIPHFHMRKRVTR